MISLSSLASLATSADKPSMPLGLGKQHMGDAVLSDLVDVEVAEGGVVVLLVLGRPIGARGCLMRPTSGTGIELILFELEQCPVPGANPELSAAMGLPWLTYVMAGLTLRLLMQSWTADVG